MIIEYGGVSDRGKVRANNEDYFCADEKNGIFIVADGMGGHKAGEVASKMACDIVTKNLEQTLTRRSQGDGSPIVFGESDPAISETANYAVSCIRVANQVIYEASVNYSQNKGMGTTLVLTLCHNNSYIIAWVGDSRAYLVRNGLIQQLTRDHSVVQEQMDKGLITPQQAEVSEYKNVLTRAMGTDAHVKPGVVETGALSGDYILLCSDGLTKMLSDEKIFEQFTAGGTAREIADRLAGTANDAGGRDNITAIVLHINGGTVWDRLISSISKL